MVDPVAPGTFIERNPRVVHRHLVEGQGGVLLHLDTGAYHGVNEIGALLWTLLETATTGEWLLAELRENLTGVTPDFEQEIRTFLYELQSRDLIRFMPTKPQP